MVRWSWAWRIPAAAGLTVFYLACCVLIDAQTLAGRVVRWLRGR